MKAIATVILSLLSICAFAQNGFTESESVIIISDDYSLGADDKSESFKFDSTKYAFPVVHCNGLTKDCFKWVPIDGKAEDIPCTTPWHIYQDLRETTITLADLLNYQTECYNDSTRAYVHTYKRTGNESLFDGCVFDGGCIKADHYGWVTHHMQPTFNGFIEWLTKRKK